MTPTRIDSIRRIGVTLGLAVLASTAATSSGLAFSARAQQMCMSDAMRLCSSEIPSISRITACMRRNKANVSAGCRMVMEQEDPASRPKPVQVAPAEQKPPAVARTEPPAPAKPAPPPIAPVVQQPVAPPVVAQPSPVVPANVAAKPVEHTPAAVVAQPAVVETKPALAVSSERTTMDVRLEQPQRARVDPDTTGQSPAAALAQAAFTEVKKAQGVPNTPPAAVPAPPVLIQSKPVQAAPIEQQPSIAAPSVVKPTEVKPAPVAKPVKVARRKQRAHQVAVAAYSPRGMGGYESYIGMAVPIMSLIISHW